MQDPARGEVWFAYLGIGEGHEQAGQRPVLILSVDKFNQGLSGLVIVVPVTTKTAKSKHIPVAPPEGGLKSPSVLLCDQVRSISKARLRNCWGSVAAPTLAAVEYAVKVLLGL